MGTGTRRGGDGMKYRSIDALVASHMRLLRAARLAAPLVEDYVQGRPDVAEALRHAIADAEAIEVEDDPA